MKKTTKIALSVVICAIMLATVFAVSSFAAKFTDTAKGAWYQKAVNYVVEHELMTGTSATTFEPATTFSRAMAAMVSAKVAGADLSVFADQTPDFVDVEANSWYANAVAWANKSGIAVGNGNRFMPSDPVTREQLVLMMMKLSQLLDIKNYNEADDLTLDGFVDADKIDSWALDGVTWAVKNGYISGNDKSEINPLGKASRAEAAQIFFNLNFVKENELLPPDTSYADALKIKQSDTPRIICWGDSLTEGCYLEWPANRYIIDHENAYPTQLAGLTGLEVLNYGVSAETALEIAERQGAIPVYIDPVTIPAERKAIEVSLILDVEGNPSEFLSPPNGLEESYSMTVYIAGVKGTLTYDMHDEVYRFTRREAGEAVTIRRLTQIVTEPMADRRSSDIIILCTGSNDRPNKGTPLAEIIAYQEAMIDYADARDRYLVLDFTAQPVVGDIEATNQAMFDHYGDRVVRLHNYFMTKALEDAGLTPTEQDLYNISIGQMPDQLICHDGLHYNPISNRLVAQQVYASLTALGLVK